MNNMIIYSGPQETGIIRLSDVAPVIEAHVGLKVVEIRVASTVSGHEEAKSSFHDERFPDEKPVALWWFNVTFESPDGKRATMVLLALEKRGLRVISYDSPRLLFYSEALRKRALEEASGLTREYLEQLEEILSYADTLWKNAYEYSQTHQGLRYDIYMFWEEFRKVGFLLRDAEDGGPQGLGFRKVYHPRWRATDPEYITGDEEPPIHPDSYLPGSQD